MTEVEFLEEQAKRLKKIAIDLKVELNISEAKVRKLERQLVAEMRPAPGTPTVDKLRILCDSDDDNGQDPMSSGEYRNPLLD